MASGISQLGLFEWLTDWLGSAFSGLIVEPLVNFFCYWVGALLYGIQLGMFYIIDAVTLVFRKAAGLDVYYQNGQAVEGDLVIQFLQSSTVQAVFISILVAAIILLFITTFIAVLKVEFDEKDNSRSGIFKSALKAIAYFAVVPVVCFLGIIVSNFVLKMLDSATSRNAHSFSTQIFTAASWDASRARNEADFAEKIWEGRNGEFSYIPGIANLGAYSQTAIADLIDNAFRTAAAPIGDNNTASFTTVGDSGFGQKTRTFSVFSVTNYQLVFFFYNPISYNYIIGYIASVMILVLLLNLLVGVICRIFELSVLFVLSPLAVSLMPLDGGDRYKSWRGAFIKRVFSAYGPILGLNLVFMVLTLMQSVTLFPPEPPINGLYNAICQLIFIFTGLVSIRSLTDMVTDLVGQGDALKQGEQTIKEAKQTAKTGAKIFGQVGNVGMMPLRAAKYGIDRGRDRRNTKKAMQDLMFNEQGNLATSADEEGVRRGVGIGARDTIRAWGQRHITHTADNPENIQFQQDVATRKQRMQETRDYINNGGQVPVYDKEGNATGEMRSVQMHASTKSMKDGLEGLKESLPFINDKAMEEAAKSFGKGAPIAGSITGYFKGKEKKKKRKDTKEEIEMKYGIEDEISATKANRSDAKTLSDQQLRMANPTAPTPTTTDPGLPGPTPPPYTPTSGGPVDVRIVDDARDEKDYVIDVNNIEAQTPTISTDADNASLNDADIQSTETTAEFENVDADSNRVDLEGDAEMRDADADINGNVDAGNVHADTVGGLGDKKLKIDDSGIRQAITSAANNTNATNRSVQAKLDRIAQGINNLSNVTTETKAELTEANKTLNNLKDNTKKKS